MAPPIEISIPTTSIASSPNGSKSFTQYNITLRLPLRSFFVQKRYSEFAKLQEALTSLVGAPPPTPLPAKHWFKSTISSPELTEDRRRGLEAFLRAIAESPDRRWRDTPTWRQFLSLPATGGGSATSSSGLGVEGRSRAADMHHVHEAGAADATVWTNLHRELRVQLHEARLQLARRDAASEAGGAGAGSKQGSSNTTAAAEAGAAAKKALVRTRSLLTALQAGLALMGEQKKVGEGELRRRRDLLAAARAERDGLEKLSASFASPRGSWADSCESASTPNSGNKEALLAGRGDSSSSRARTGCGRVLGAPLPETERTRVLDNVGVVQLQRQQMQEQDQDIEELAKILKRQREMGLQINDEVERQSEMLDQMDRNASRLETKLKVVNNKARKLGK